MTHYSRGVDRILDTPAGRHILAICRAQPARTTQAIDNAIDWAPSPAPADTAHLAPLPPACTACGERGGISKTATACACNGAINGKHTAHTCSHCGTTRYTSRCTTPKE